MLLSEAEIIQLTHKRARSAQVVALRRMGLEHKIRPDGTVAILRSHVEAVLSGQSEHKTKTEAQPNWSAINGKKKKS